MFTANDMPPEAAVQVADAILPHCTAGEIADVLAYWYGPLADYPARAPDLATAREAFGRCVAQYGVGNFGLGWDAAPEDMRLARQLAGGVDAYPGTGE